ncbi:MAG: GNAT family protein [Bacteroidota bacterium]
MFHFDANYYLKNEVAELIPLQLDQEEFLYPPSNDDEIWKYFEEQGRGRKAFQQYFKRALQKRIDGEEYTFAIKDLRLDEFAGMTRIYAVDNTLRNVKIGHTWIGKQFQGTGLNKNCKYLLFDFLFDQIKMERIGFGASSQNTRSIRAMESVGCVREGRLRGFLPGTSTIDRIDIALLSVLKSEWESEGREKLKRKIATKIT